MTWNHITTRVFGLLEIWLATEVYPKFPIKEGGFNLDTVVVGKNGIIDRYVDQDQLDEFAAMVKKGNFVELLKGFQEYEESVLFFFDKDPIENRVEFMQIFRQLWIHEITAFLIGLYTIDPESIEIISQLRGVKSAQHIATSDFLPKLYNQITELNGIDCELLKYALPDEILSLELDLAKLSLRQKQYVIEQIGGSMRLLVNQDAENYIQDFLKNVDNTVDENISEFKGNPAYPGEVFGRVVVIVHENELANVQEGDILVSPMTRTSFLSAMQKAAAFVTDEGGVTCHAAIMARELKKPCVVGTKIASKVLKNGMQVEVNATEGIIKITK
jgi:phosphohistidine swiveling domain-containing protein